MKPHVLLTLFCESSSSCLTPVQLWPPLLSSSQLLSAISALPNSLSNNSFQQPSSFSSLLTSAQLFSPFPGSSQLFSATLTSAHLFSTRLNSSHLLPHLLSSLNTEPGFTHRSFYTQMLLHTASFYTQQAFTHKPLHGEAFTHRDAFLHRASFYTHKTCTFKERF